MLGQENIGLPQLQSIKILQSIGNPEYQISSSDILGLVLGGGLGWWISSKYPNMVVKYVGVVVGAELGILIARMMGGTTIMRR